MDTYVFQTGDGYDIIAGDDDGGRIEVDGVTLRGDLDDRSSASYPIWTWESGGHRFLYELVGATSRDLRRPHQLPQRYSLQSNSTAYVDSFSLDVNRNPHLQRGTFTTTSG